MCLTNVARSGVHSLFLILSTCFLAAQWGMLVAWGSYRQYFPPVSNSRLKGRAYSIRTWGKEMNAPNEPQGIAIEPLRQPANLCVEQKPMHASQGNVFRDQLSRLQRQRGGLANCATDFAPPSSISINNISIGACSPASTSWLIIVIAINGLPKMKRVRARPWFGPLVDESSG